MPHRRGWLLIALVAMLTAIPAQARRLPRLAGGTVLSARSAYSAGPITFYAEFFNVEYLSPALPTSPHDPGSLQFSGAGKIQVTFPSPAVPLRITCYTDGQTVRFHEVVSPATVIDSVGGVPGNAAAPAVLDMPDFATPPVVVTVTLSTGNPLPVAWTLSYCSIAPRP